MKTVSNMILLGIFLSISTCFGRTSDNITDVKQVEQLMLRFEHTVSDLQTEFHTQQQKQAAILSSLLSKLTSTTEELTNVRTMVKSLEEKHNSTLAELEEKHNSTLAELEEKHNSTLAELEEKHNSTLAELEKVHEELKDFSGIKTELNSLRKDYDIVITELAETKSDLNTTTNEVLNTKSRVEELETETNAKLHQLNASCDVAQSGLSSVMMQLGNNSESIKSLYNAVYQMQTSVAFEARQPSDLINMSLSQVLNFSDVLFNDGTSYNQTTGIFTAPLAGVYLFWAHIMNFDTTRLGVELIKNGQIITRGYVPSESRFSHASINTAMFLGKGDRVWMNKTSLSSKIRGGSFSSYGGALLRAHQ